MDVKISSQPLQLSKKTSFVGSIFESGFLIVLIIIAFVYLVGPKQESFSKVSEMKVQLEGQRDDLSRKKQVFATLLQELQDESAAVKSAEEMLPTQDRPSRVYILLESILQSASLPAAVVSVDTTPQAVEASKDVMTAQSGSALKKNSITISATGTVDQLDNLLKLLEISSRLIQVKSVEVSQGSNEQLLFKVTAETYSYLAGLDTK